MVHVTKLICTVHNYTIGPTIYIAEEDVRHMFINAPPPPTLLLLTFIPFQLLNLLYLFAYSNNESIFAKY